MAQSAFERFRYSFFEDPMSAREGLDIDALHELSGADRARAEDMLLEFLPDARAIVGLGELRSKKAAAALQVLFTEHIQTLRVAQTGNDQHWGSGMLAHISKALWQIEPHARWRDALIDIYNFCEDSFSRMDAVEALYVVHDPIAVQLLIRALDDSDSLVRTHAGRALLAIHGLPSEAAYDNEHMLYKVMSSEAERHRRGRDEILAAISGRAIAPEPD